MKKLFKNSLKGLASIVLALSILGTSVNPSHADYIPGCSGAVRMTAVTSTAGVLISSQSIALVAVAIASGSAGGLVDKLIVLSTNVIAATQNALLTQTNSPLLTAPVLIATVPNALNAIMPAINMVAFPFAIPTGMTQSTRSAVQTPNGMVAVINNANTPGYVFTCQPGEGR